MDSHDSTESTPPAKITRSRYRYLRWALTAILIWIVGFRGGGLPGFLTTSAARTLYFKLPLAGVTYHWEFLEPEAFLAGELTLRIINKDRDQTLVVFRDGKINTGWEMIGEPRKGGGFYFGFATDSLVNTRYDDSLIITLTALKDLRGRGPFTEGTLKAGTWQMSGRYSSIYGGRLNPMDLFILHGDPPMAFMECWNGVWQIEITKLEGWKGPQPKDEGKVGFLRKLMPERGTTGKKCGSHL